MWQRLATICADNTTKPSRINEATASTAEYGLDLLNMIRTEDIDEINDDESDKWIRAQAKLHNRK